MSADCWRPIVDILVSLSRDWFRTKHRFERRSACHRYQATRFERQVECLDRMTVIASEIRRKACRARYEAKIEEVDARAQQESDEYHLHPYPDVVAILARWTGLERSVIREAAAAEFDGCLEIVTKLRQHEGRAEIGRLYRQLLDEHPAIASRIQLTIPSQNPAAATRTGIRSQLPPSTTNELDNAVPLAAQETATAKGKATPPRPQKLSRNDAISCITNTLKTRRNRKWTLRELWKKTGWSTGWICEQKAWKEYQAKRGKPKLPTAPKSVSLTEKLESCLGEEDETLNRLRQEEIDQLTKEQLSDWEDSPLDQPHVLRRRGPIMRGRV